jgi:orotate phosphoribosyltransferase
VAPQSGPYNVDAVIERRWGAVGVLFYYAERYGAKASSSGGEAPRAQKMTRDAILDLFRRSGALLEGHFRLSSGLHSPGYLQCALVLQFPDHAEALGRAIADAARSWSPTVVLSPALGGIVIGQEVGRGLGVRAIFAERQDGALTLRRGFTLGPTDRVLVIEDVLTTGGSTRETIEVARAGGAGVVGAAAIVDRSGGSAALDVPFRALLDMSLPTYSADACPLCAQGAPLTKPGSRV